MADQIWIDFCGNFIDFIESFIERVVVATRNFDKVHNVYLRYNKGSGDFNVDLS